MKRQRFPVMLFSSERLALQELARVEGGLSCAALVRRLIRREAQQHGLWPPQKSGVRHVQGVQHD
jgi:hypothetical protein